MDVNVIVGLPFQRDTLIIFLRESSIKDNTAGAIARLNITISQSNSLRRQNHLFDIANQVLPLLIFGLNDHRDIVRMLKTHEVVTGVRDVIDTVHGDGVYLTTGQPDFDVSVTLIGRHL